MANVAHASLTGANLHEPKGADTAVADKVYLSNGAGSGSWSYPAGQAYGEIYIAGGATNFTLDSTAGVYTKLDPGTAWDDNGNRKVTLDGDNGQLTVTVAGVYLVSFWCHFSTEAATAGGSYYFKYAVNGSTSARLVAVSKPTNGVDLLNVSATGIVTLAANDVLSMYVTGDASTQGKYITPKEAGLSVVMLRAV